MKTSDKIRDYVKKNPAASYRDIQRAVGLKSVSTVSFHLKRNHNLTVRAQLRILRQENERFRDALEKIASCDAYHKDDVVAIAIRALAATAGSRPENGGD